MKEIKMRTVSQKEKMLNFMKKGKTLSLVQAEKMFKSQNVTARINDLRNDGHKIQCLKNTSGVTAWKLAA